MAIAIRGGDGRGSASVRGCASKPHNDACDYHFEAWWAVTDATVTDESDEHIGALPAGSGWTESWEHLSTRRESDE